MPSQKAKEVVKVLRGEIVGGAMAPGSKLPTYDALTEQFAVTRPTLARAIESLRKEGLIVSRGKRGLFVAERLPHNSRYYWITSEQPGSEGWTGFLAAMYDVIQRGEANVPGEITPLIGVDGRANNPSYRKLCEVLEQRSAAGLYLISSATMFLLPALEAPGLPRVAIWAPMHHAGLVRLEFDALIERACERLAMHGGRIALLSHIAEHLTVAERRLIDAGVPSERVVPLHVGLLGAAHVAELLFSRTDHPAALFISDDNLVEPVIRGMKRAKVRPGEDVFVLAHCNWPRPLGPKEGIERVGFDVREVLQKGHALLEDIKNGVAPTDKSVVPRFAADIV